ncbi:hypothetical protein QBC42DRAFT_315007 [Cladorrhinum samala]|uniref:Uncharacterized protein n=1 Tax=Cladorrhinum samala TaxID=585594 RepID=A0AAV9HDQ1_9PEZI|nr:hypothetical protein QBC42DRAFT_315007 [Cladorrhinum samala]
MNLITLLSVILGFLVFSAHGAPANMIKGDWDLVGPDHSVPLRERDPANIENNFNSINATVPAPLQKRNAWCETQKTAWENRISDRSSFTVHCEKLARNIKGDGTCTPGSATRTFARSSGAPSTASIAISSMAGITSKLSATCTCLDFKSPVNWGIYPIKGTWPMPDPDAEKDDERVEGPVEWVETEGYTLEELEMLIGQ